MEKLILIPSISLFISFLIWVWYDENHYHGTRLRKGKTFSIREKKEILNLLDEMYEKYDDGERHGMCFLLSENLTNIVFDKLRKEYHNVDYYNQNGLKTIHGGYWWKLSDCDSRMKATNILINAILND